MVADDRALGAVVLGIAGIVLLKAREADGEVWLHAETTATRIGCPDCGVVAIPHDRRTSVVRDVALAGGRRGSCGLSGCGAARSRRVRGARGPSSIRRSCRGRC